MTQLEIDTFRNDKNLPMEVCDEYIKQVIQFQRLSGKSEQIKSDFFNNNKNK